MRLSKLFLALTVSLAFLAVAAPAHAQVSETKSIKIKQPKIKKEKYKGTVVSATLQGITVRHEKDLRIIRTFRLSEKAGAQMIKAFEKGGYQAGDKVTIIHPQGADVALEVKGKPSAGR